MNKDLETLRDEFEHALGGLDQQQTQMRPVGQENKWCIQEIVGHLLLTYGATERAMDARIQKRTPTRARRTALQMLGQFFLLKVGYFPRGRKAPEVVTCAPGTMSAAPGGTLIAQTAAALESMHRKIAEVEELFGLHQHAVSHMVLGPLSAAQWRQFHLVHGRHHLKQIVAIRKTYQA